MDVFLDLVVIGRKKGLETLNQISKVDKSVNGKQLASLIAMLGSRASDGTQCDDKDTRTKLSKNAYALMRLGRYRHAAAVFLCANPPFLKVTLEHTCCTGHTNWTCYVKSS